VSEPGAHLSADDIGEYCRAVEDHLTRANAGHLVRIVGAGFELVRGWAMAGVPLSVVYRGIDLKAERHREGQARRPLRIEFCEPDVRAVFDNWRRAIGVWSGAGGAEEPAGGEAPGDPARDAPAHEPKKPPLSRHLDRAIDRLSRVGGRLDLPVELRDACDRLLHELAEMRASAAKLRGPARDALVARLAPLDAQLAEAVRASAPETMRAPAAAEALADLAPYRSRLSNEAWQRSLDVTTDRLLRDRLGLPLLEL
jgi:hypothetical protein